MQRQTCFVSVNYTNDNLRNKCDRAESFYCCCYCRSVVIIVVVVVAAAVAVYLLFCLDGRGCLFWFLFQFSIILNRHHIWPKPEIIDEIDNELVIEMFKSHQQLSNINPIGWKISLSIWSSRVIVCFPEDLNEVNCLVLYVKKNELIYGADFLIGHWKFHAYLTWKSFASCHGHRQCDALGLCWPSETALPLFHYSQNFDVDNREPWGGKCCEWFILCSLTH